MGPQGRAWAGWKRATKRRLGVFPCVVLPAVAIVSCLPASILQACWSVDGAQIYAGRRNGTVDVWDTRQFGRASGGTPRLLRTIRNPISSGAVSCVVSFPDGNHVAW